MGIGLVLLKILILAVEEIIFLVAADFQHDFPQIIGNLDHVLFKLDGVEVMVGKPADEADGQDASGKPQDYLLAYIQIQEIPPGGQNAVGPAPEPENPGIAIL